jgi:hypothetical protein
MDRAVHLKGRHPVSLGDQGATDVELVELSAGLDAHGVGGE